MVYGRPSKCLQHHQQRWCKILWTGVNLLLQTYNVFSLIDFLVQILRIFVGKISMKNEENGGHYWFYFSYLINCYYVDVLYSLILKTVLLKYIWLNMSFCQHYLFYKSYAFFGVNFVLLKSCWCKMLDIQKVCSLALSV